MRQISESILQERKARVLYAVIHEYIKTGKPVGSSVLEQKYKFNLSPATLRNLMAELEKDGYLTHPHTSAGRIPTDAGYKAYVNSLVELQRLAVEEEERIKQEYEKKTKEIESLLSQTSKILSGLSNYTGFITAPKTKVNEIRNIELMQVSKSQVMVILLTKTGIVKHKMINLSVDSEELYELKKFLNNKLRGLTIEEASKRLIVEVEKYQDKQNDMLQLAEQICSVIDSIQEDIYVDGTSNVLSVPDFTDFESAKSLMKLNEDKDRLIEIIGKDLDEATVNVKIGGQDLSELKNLSVVKTSYSYGDKIVGVLGIIGPKRMDYDKMMALVNSVSNIVNGFLLKMGDEQDEE
ncbi:heat-inducible transcriptional repressor HrcA [Candidatus Ruminimicrobiellum ovillum]|uniref:heat-inducible transcriptional repressor HrcA n=1 Tax=Candidatus Ruminimicrobiellum ovillum TaxID=1947927 RepID=UPI00355A5652